jgi:hypothetical protein
VADLRGLADRAARADRQLELGGEAVSTMTSAAPVSSIARTFSPPISTSIIGGPESLKTGSSATQPLPVTLTCSGLPTKVR